jgi:hypothetical protein
MGHGRAYLYFIIYAVALLFSVILESSAIGQTDTTKIQKNDNNVKYRWAIQFQMPYQFTRRGDEDVFAYIKYNLKKGKAIRLGLGFSGNLFWNKTKTLSDSTTLSIKNNQDETGIKIHYQYSFSNSKRLYGYWAIGPMFTFSWRDEAYDHDNNGVYEDRDWQRGWEIGISANIGAEYMVRSDLGISAEYELESYYGHSKRIEYYSNYSSSGRRDISNHFTWQLNDIKIGASLYF